MTQQIRRLLPLLLAVSLGWLMIQAPFAFWREAYFVLLMLAVTVPTRSASWRAAASALSMGIGVAAPVMVAIGWLLTAAGLDLSEDIGSWGVVPVVEEALKLGVVLLAAWRYRRATGLEFNPSDWLVAGCACGAGFAMVENATLVTNDPGVLRDMARQYGPSWLVPGAWGAAGYVGHAAATGLAAAGIGLARSLQRRATVRGRSDPKALIALIAPAIWVTLEHVLANLHVNTASNATFVLGNGRLTPWLFVAVLALVVFDDYQRAGRALAHSAKLRARRAVVREALAGSKLPARRSLLQRLNVFMGEFKTVNAVAWLTLERLTPGTETK
jgi:RsiW-degrading membrane proteinase PrsW (M82 family)